MRIEFLRGPDDNGVQEARGWVEDSGKEFKFGGSEDCKVIVNNCRGSLQIKRGQVVIYEKVPKLIGDRPSPKDTLEFMLTMPQLKRLIRKV